MQNKGAIWLFTVLMFLACLIAMSYSFFTGALEEEAKETATIKIDSLVQATGRELAVEEEDSLRDVFEQEFLTSRANDEVIPVVGTTYREAKKREINLGLDLQGGMHVTMEVSVPELVRALGSNSANPTFQKALKLAEDRMADSQDDYVTLFGQAVEEVDPEFKLAAVFHNMNNKEKFPRDATNAEIINIIRLEAEDAVKRTEQVLRKRIDNLGVVQPKIQRLTTSDRIVVELPGVKDHKRVRKILQGTAKLEFWETYDNNELYEFLGELNEVLKMKDSISKLGDAPVDSSIASVTEEAATTAEEVSAEPAAPGDSVAAEETTGDLFAELGGEAGDSAAGGDTSNLGTADVNNPVFEVLIPALNQDEQGQLFKIPGPVIGYATENNIAKVDALLATPEAKTILQKNLGASRIKFLWSAKGSGEGEAFYRLHAIKMSGRNSEAPLEGDAISEARVDTDPNGNPEVTLIMNSTGAKKWADITSANIGKYFAIVLDDYIYSAPVIQDAIKTGSSRISGSFTPEEAQDLANVLKAGKLPAPANIIEEAVVGPSLGQKAVEAGIQSFILALLIVLIYMFFYYNRAGLVADIALFANIFFVFGVLTALGATLTLPGIAGIVLTIGMSVDANVLIYERIREEIAAGKGLKLAVSDGYRNALSSILDANITTLLTGIILGVFGTGPIKGFATTLIIGILTSLFSALFITRLIFEWQMGRNMKINFSTKLTEGAFKNLNISFIPRRRLFYLISSLIIIGGIASFAMRGLNYGVDFTGGRSYVVSFNESADVQAISSTLGAAFISEYGIEQRPEVKIFGTSNQVKITTKYLIEQKGQEVDGLVEGKLNEGLTSMGLDYTIESSQKVEPTIADDIKQSAVWAVLFSLVIIFLYILLRFKRWQYGVGALIAMFHDVLVVLAMFSLFYGVLPFSLEIDQAFIAAILTVVGYSINDTVVVFDRIREHLGLFKHRRYEEVVNGALNSTLSRTVNTSLSTFVVLLLIFIFGGEVIQGFIFALMIGVAVGTYSSLCVATPILMDFGSKQLEAEAAAAVAAEKKK
jgi:SecD/SecF fusion protein